MRLLVFCFLLLVQGCSGNTNVTRHINAPSNPSNLDLRARDAAIEVILHHVITPDGPGSWMSGAKWNEYVVSLKSVSEEVRVERVRLLDGNGVFLNQEMPNVYANWDAYNNAQKQRGLATYGAGVATTVVSGVTGIPLLGAPFALAGVGAPDHTTVMRDQDKLLAELKRRQLPANLELTRGGTITGSVFFAPAQARFFVINYSSVANQPRELRIEIPN